MKLTLRSWERDEEFVCHDLFRFILWESHEEFCVIVCVIMSLFILLCRLSSGHCEYLVIIVIRINPY